jgi:hypothetical protein
LRRAREARAGRRQGSEERCGSHGGQAGASRVPSGKERPGGQLRRQPGALRAGKSCRGR